jgi:DNA polymerase-3 subunit delta
LKVALDKLSVHLKSAFAPVYLIAGDEPLQREETADAVIMAAKSRGYTDREVLFAERGFDWQQLADTSANLSLFASKRMLEVRLASGKPGNEGAEALCAYAQNPAPDTVLLVISAKLERGGGRWAEALERAGVLVQIWPVETRQLPAWIERRMRARGLTPTPEAAAFIAARVEGNLLAAAQEIEKLRLLHGEGAVDLCAAQSAVADSARYDAFKLVDAALAGEAARVAHILEGLRQEGTEPPVILGALNYTLRDLANKAWEIEAGTPAAQVLAAGWPQRRPLIQQALKRGRARDWQRLLQRAARADRIIKGQAAGRAWDELLDLSESLAGLSLPA